MLENIFYNNEFTYLEKKFNFEKKILLIGKGEILKKAYFFLRKILKNRPFLPLTILAKTGQILHDGFSGKSPIF